MIEDFLAGAVGIPKRYLTAPIARLDDIDHYLFDNKEDYNDIKEERDEFLSWLKEFEAMASEETYLEATLWLKNKMKGYYIKEAKKELNGYYSRKS